MNATIIQLINFIDHLPHNQTQMKIMGIEINLKDTLKLELIDCKTLFNWSEKTMLWIPVTRQIINKILSLNPPENIKNELIAISI
jgi:hypothetical protein